MGGGRRGVEVSRVSESCGRRGGARGTHRWGDPCGESDRLVASHRGRGRLVGSPGRAGAPVASCHHRSRSVEVSPPLASSPCPRPRRGRAVLSSPRRLGQDHTTRRVHRGAIHRVHRARRRQARRGCGKNREGRKKPKKYPALARGGHRETYARKRNAFLASTLSRHSRGTTAPRSNADYCPTTAIPLPSPSSGRSSPLLW